MMRIKGRNQYSWQPLCSSTLLYRFLNDAEVLSNTGIGGTSQWHDDSDLYLRKHISITLAKNGIAYRGDGRLDSRDLAPLNVGSGIKKDACFLPPFLPACHSVSSSKCQAISLFSIKELRDEKFRERELRQRAAGFNCNTLLLWEWIQSHLCCCQDKCSRLGAAHIHKQCPSSCSQKRTPSLNHGHLSSSWNNDIWMKPLNEMKTLTLVQLIGCALLWLFSLQNSRCSLETDCSRDFTLISWRLGTSRGSVLRN